MRKRNTALVTGATGGIGEELCREFARHGYDLVITARDPRRLDSMKRRLERTYHVRVWPLAADLNQDSATRQLYERVRDLDLEIDVLVNNAGFGMGGYFFHNLPRIQDAMIRVNLMAPTRLCRLFLPSMLERGGGAVLNMASTASFVPGPMNSIYCASKAFVLSMTEALADELRDTPIKVTAVCPGATHTGFAHRANMETTLLFNYGVMDPKYVARCAYHGLMRGQRTVIPGLRNKLMIGSIRLVPRCWSTRVSGVLQKQFLAME